MNSGNPKVRARTGHCFEIRESTNDRDPSRGLGGFVTTYQSFQSEWSGEILAEFKRSPYILCLDEPHRVEEGSTTHQKLRHLVDAVPLCMFMTGTLTRGNRGPVAFLNYDNNGQVTTDIEGWERISYSRSDALNDEAIIPLNFIYGEGSVEWLGNGEPKQSLLSQADKDDVRDAVWTALNTEYAEHLLETGIKDWQGYRKNVYRDSRLLIVAPTQPTARTYQKVAKKMGVVSEIAISDEGKEALNSIRKFRDADLPALTTVAMAYEGMDVPPITHIVALTAYRSTPWLEQMLNRATRYNPAQGPWNQQQAFAYVPNDPLMRDAVEKIRSEQEDALRKKGLGEGGDGGGVPHSDCIPLRSGLTGMLSEGLDDALRTTLNQDAEARRIMAEFGFPGSVPTQQFLAAATSLFNPKPAEVIIDTPRATPRRREEKINKAIHTKASKIDYKNNWPQGTMNSVIVQKFGGSRTELPENKLNEIWKWIQEEDNKTPGQP